MVTKQTPFFTDVNMSLADLVGREIMIPLSAIAPDPKQPRKDFDKGKLNELADSIKTVGQLVPALLRPRPGKTGEFFLKQGERRWRACKIAGKNHIRAIVSDSPAEQSLIEAIIDNYVRVGLSHLETAMALAELKEAKKVTDTELGKFFGKSAAWVQQHLNILRLPDEVLALMGPPIPEKKRLSFSIAYLLLLIPDRGDQIKYAQSFQKNQTKFGRAKSIIYKITIGLKKIGEKKIVAYSEHRRLSRFLANTHDNSEIVRDAARTSMAEILRMRDLNECNSLMRLLEQCQANIHEIKNAMQVVIDEKSETKKLN